jgi:hypothetical protein
MAELKMLQARFDIYESFIEAYNELFVRQEDLLLKPDLGRYFLFNQESFAFCRVPCPVFVFGPLGLLATGSFCWVVWGLRSLNAAFPF